MTKRTSKYEAWVDKLSDILDEAVMEYALSNLLPIDGALGSNFVLSALQYNRNPVVLKLSSDIEGLEREILALKAFEGYGAVQIIEHKKGELLLERAKPGKSLKSYFPSMDKEAIEITCIIMKRLHKAPYSKKSFPHIRDWLKALDKEWDIPENHLNKARILRDKLLLSSGADVLLHGDLHHGNILNGKEGWVVIDPKGVIGEEAFEVGAFIRNPMPRLLQFTGAKNIIKKRIEYFSKILDISESRISDWCFVQSVLAWIWALEDDGDLSYFKELTEVL